MGNSIGETAAEFIAAADTRTFTPEVVDMAKCCLVDWMGVAIGAVDQPVSHAVRDTVSAWGADGRSRILCGPKTAPALAALASCPPQGALLAPRQGPRREPCSVYSV